MKKIFLSLPQLSLFVVILALLKVFLYYSNFNVPIKYYLGLSELALQIADDLFIIIPIVLFMYFFSIDLETSNDTQSKDKLPNTEKSTSKIIETPKGKIRKFLDKVMPYVLMSIFFLVLVGGSLFLLFNSRSYSDKILGFSVLLVDFFFFIFITRHEKLEKIFTSTGMMLSLFITMFLIMFILRTTGEIDRVEKGSYIGTKIITTDSTYISTDSAFYIGQTSNYVFFYNRKDKHTTILPTTEVKKIELYTK